MGKALSIGGMAIFSIWSPFEPLWWMERCGQRKPHPIGRMRVNDESATGAQKGSWI
jgi:hypothetical protein